MKEDKDILKAFTVILRASRSIEDVMRKDAAESNLNLTEFAVLELLYSKGKQPIQIIGKKILISSGSITYVVDKLEKKGYVARNGDEKDRRIIYAVLTEQGKELMDRIFSKHQAKIAEVFEPLEATEVNEIIKLMKRIGYRAKEL